MLPSSETDVDQPQPQDSDLRGTLLIELAEAQRRSGAPIKAQETLMRALDFARAIASADVIAQAAWQLGILRVQVGVPIPKTAIRLFEEALARTDRQNVRAAVLASLALALASPTLAP